MRIHFLALAAALVVSTPCIAQTSTGSQPASVPASAPAPGPSLASDQLAAREAAARTVVHDFIRAMFAGESSALKFVTFSDPQNQPIGQTLLGEVLAEQRLRKAVTAAFGDKPFKVGRSDAEIADFEKAFANATVRVNPDGKIAAVYVPLGINYVVAFEDSKGLVDFEKTQSNVGPLPKMTDVEILTKMTAAFDQLTKDVTAKKFGSIDEVNKEVGAIQALRPSAQPRAIEVPETTRAAAPGPASRP